MKIKMLVMDVDGTLTDGHIYISSEGECMKAFNVKDGYGIVQIQREGGSSCNYYGENFKNCGRKGKRIKYNRIISRN